MGRQQRHAERRDLRPAQLAGIKLAAAAHGAKVAAAAVVAVKALRAHGWDVALFKGIATERRWYPESGTRPAADADLLLDATGARSVDEILAALAPDHPLRGRAQALIDQGFIQSVDLVIEDIWIDLHVDPIKVGISLPGIEQLWERFDVLKFNSMGIRALDAEASLLQAAIHLQKDRFFRLHRFADVADRSELRPRLGLDPGFCRQDRVGPPPERVPASRFGDAGNPLAGGRREKIPPEQSIWAERTRLGGSVGMTRPVRTHHWIPFTIPGRRRDALQW